MEAAPNRRSYIRLAVMRSLLMGLERGVVAQQFCRSERVVRLWIAMFNLGGIDALTTKRPVGRGRRVKLERLRDLLMPVLENPRQAGELHWTGVKLHGYLKERLGLEVGYSTTVRYLHELGYNLRVPRPRPERQNEEQRRTFLDQLRTWQAEAGLELRFADECGVEGVRARGGAGALGRPAESALSRRPYPRQRHWGGVSGQWRMLHDDF